MSSSGETPSFVDYYGASRENYELIDGRVADKLYRDELVAMKIG